MAYLTQYSGSVPVIKFNIDQSVMTIGQNLDMDICVPEEGIADYHASLEAVGHDNSYRFVITSREDEPEMNINGETVSITELQDGDWVIIGDVEFQFTDDGVYDIKQIEAAEVENVEITKLQVIKNDTVEPTTRAYVDDIQVEAEPMGAETLQEDNRFSRRLNFF